MAELISIPISYFEVVADYEGPSFKLWMDRAAVVQGVFDALKPWNPNVDNVEIVTTGLPSEQGIKFKLPEKRASFFFGPGSCKFTKDDADWASAEETIHILDTALSTLVKLTGIIIKSQKTLIALHFQPKTQPFFDILRPFVPAELAALDTDAVKTMAVVLKWDKRKVTIDGSGQIANGVFLRFEREFDGKASYEQIAHQLKADEDGLFAVLGVQDETA
jgi:hypothetical protein